MFKIGSFSRYHNIGTVSPWRLFWRRWRFHREAGRMNPLLRLVSRYVYGILTVVPGLMIFSSPGCFFQPSTRSGKPRSGPWPTTARQIGRATPFRSFPGCVRSRLVTPCGRSTSRRWRPSSTLARPRASKFRTSGRRKRRGIF